MKLRVKVVLADERDRPFMGIGIMWLLQRIEKFGSINEAAKDMRMSYTKASRILRKGVKHMAQKRFRRFVKKIFPVILVLFTLTGAGFCAELYFFCGSAVRVPMDEIIANYEKDTGNKVNVVYGGSGTLLFQMELSKRGDVYLCGSPDYVAIGEKRRLLIPGTSRIVSYLVPAIIVPKDNPKNIQKLEDLARPGVRVGMGNPETVCLGLYGLEILDKNDLMEKVLPNVAVFAKSCEDAATLAVLEKVDAILGWDVFASWNPDKVTCIKINPKQIPRLSYVPIALPVFVRDRKLAENFIAYVLSPKSRRVWRRWGYAPDLKQAKKYAPYSSLGGEYPIPEKYRQILRGK